MFLTEFRAGGITLGSILFCSLFFSSVLTGQTATLTIVPQAAPAEPGSTATATVTVEGSSAVSGFSFGLAHDPSILTLFSMGVVAGADLAATRGGAGPEFLVISVFPTGFTMGAVINVNAAGTDLAANTAHNVAAISYSVSPTAPSGGTPLAFTEALGTPPVALSVGMGLEFVEPPTIVEASLFTSPPFIRGDINQTGAVTISDAIGVLAQLFAGLPMTCPAASDVNDTGSVNVADAIAILAYLFQSGAPPAAPAGTCGLPAVPSTLDCQSFSCP